MGLVNTDSQWLFLLTDTPNTTDVSAFLPNYAEGQNIAFIFNTSDSSTLSQNNFNCFIKKLFQLYVNTVHATLRSEETRYFQSTEDEWKRSKPSVNDRNNNFVQNFKVHCKVIVRFGKMSKSFLKSSHSVFPNWKCTYLLRIYCSRFD